MQPIDGLDEFAEEYLRLTADAEVANEKVSMLRKLLIERVLLEGVHPPRATKTKALVGNIYELRVSEPTEISVDTKMALRIRKACKRSRAWNLFRKLFRCVETFTLAPDSQKVLAELPASAPRGLRALYAQAVQVKALSPALEVRRRDKSEAAA